MKVEVKKSITIKLFLITLAVLLCFIAFMLTFESIVFPKIYENKRTENIKNTAENFKTNYDKVNSDDEAASLIKEYEDKNECKIAILNNYGNIKYISSKNSDSSMQINIIKDIMFSWTSNPGAFIEMRRTGKSVTKVFENKTYNVKNIVCIVPNLKTNEYIFAISSFSPITEASSAMRSIFVYVFAVGVLIVLLLAFIYSNMITKPLIRISNTAAKMAHLDFTEKCDAYREDEIGNLGKNLNILSINLDNALSSLKDANEKLIRDIEKEKALEKMRKEFVAGVSHELKTPLGLIEGYAEGLKDNIVTSEEEKEYYLDVIMDEAANMGKLISDMLDLSQLESGNFKLNKEVFDIGKLVWKCSQKYYAVLNEKKIDLDINVINGEIVGDKYRIEQVLNNYINNAIKYAKEKIYINMTQNENEITTEVINDGEKIEQEDLEKIWDKFYKADKSRNRKIGGTGLGLSIVKNIIQLHGGKYGVLNNENGVNFYFSLPKHKD